MNKLVVGLVVILLSGMTQADVSIDFRNDSTPFLSIDGENFVDQALVQLIWNSSAPIPSSVDVNLGLLAAGDTLLKQFLTTAGEAGGWGDLGYQLDNYNVSLNPGYLTVRIFDNARIAKDDFYLEYNIDVDGVLTEFSATDPLTVYQTNDIFGEMGDLSTASYQIIPEPAVAGLIVIFGGSMLAGRRLFKRSVA